jgi:glutathione synthase/RimK-type ligase-like ATP-grasp enzyme
MNTIYTFCTKHDENLLALNQEALLLQINFVPVYFHNLNEELFNILKSTIDKTDYIMVLNCPFGSCHLQNFLSNFQYKKCLNIGAYQQTTIGSKQYQQSQIFANNPNFAIPTYTKKTISNNFTFPLIAKPDDGTCGSGVKLIHNYIEVLSLEENYILQPFIPNDGDWRVVVTNHKAISAIKRLGKKNQVTNNIATGNFAIAETNISILDNIYEIAELASKSMNFDYVGIDIIKDIDQNKYYFLESNERPTFETSQILTGINIAKQIIHTLVKT